MPRSAPRSYSRYSREAAALLGGLIRAARKERRMTELEVAERAGISRGLLHRIEKGDLKCELGAAFEAAAIVGVKLFDVDEPALTSRIRQVEDKLALLPKAVRKKSRVIVDDF